ncbi:hypothetical protein [Martelella soudanensis]|uniref:hypothetical protein n=1 Tax=unclassified Martelella TaxID=2629616 RepID=UPI0015DE423B|nr:MULTISPECIES: hypothetical protein [unclassified Martelella]
MSYFRTNQDRRRQRSPIAAAAASIFGHSETLEVDITAAIESRGIEPDGWTGVRKPLMQEPAAGNF